MKYLLSIIALVALTISPLTSTAGVGFKGEKFQKVFYFEHGGKGSLSGLSANNAAAIADKDLMSIEAGMIIQNAFIIVDTAVTGATVLELGDDDDADGYVVSANITIATPGIYGNNAKVAGAYLRVQTAGATDAADIYVVPSSKYYSAAGKTLKFNETTASTAGKFRLVVEGYKANL